MFCIEIIEHADVNTVLMDFADKILLKMAK